MRYVMLNNYVIDGADMHFENAGRLPQATPVLWDERTLMGKLIAHTKLLDGGEL
jgi:hypothetical protein